MRSDGGAPVDGRDGRGAAAGGVCSAGRLCCALRQPGRASLARATTPAILKWYSSLVMKSTGQLAMGKGHQPGIERQARERGERGEKQRAERRKKPPAPGKRPQTEASRESSPRSATA